MNYEQLLAEKKEQMRRIKSEMARLRNENAELRHKIQYEPKKSKELLLQEVWDMPELPEDFFNDLTLQGQGFATGSAVYSDAEPADLDFVVNVPPTVYEGYGVNTQDSGYWETDGMTVVYAHRDGKLLNIICLSDYDNFKAWQAATDIMKLLKENMWVNILPGRLGLNFDRKWVRVRLFRALRDILYPVKPRQVYLELDEAIKYNKCRRCGREAINFIDKNHREMWESDGFCDRCRGYK